MLGNRREYPSEKLELVGVREPLDGPPEHHSEYPSEELHLVWARDPDGLPEHLFAFQYLEPQSVSPLHLLLIEFPLDTHLSLDLSHRVFL